MRADNYADIAQWTTWPHAGSSRETTALHHRCLLSRRAGGRIPPGALTSRFTCENTAGGWCWQVWRLVRQRLTGPCRGIPRTRLASCTDTGQALSAAGGYSARTADNCIFHLPPGNRLLLHGGPWPGPTGSFASVLDYGATSPLSSREGAAARRDVPVHHPGQLAGTGRNQGVRRDGAGLAKPGQLRYQEPLK